MPNDSLNNNQKLDKNQKIAITALSVFSILIVVLWLAQLRRNIYGPFLATNSSGTAQTQVNATAQADEQAQKNKDTDGDGLSDWDELNVYHTSPYLADTDSDGLADGTEIKNNTDPNCPQGRTCAGTGFSTAGQASSTTGTANSPDNGLSNLQNQNNTLDNLSGQPANSGATVGGQPAGAAGDALNNLDAASLRQLLLQAGMQKEVLDKISDAELMKSYGEVTQ
jgi:hypothetical protein